MSLLSRITRSKLGMSSLLVGAAGLGVASKTLPAARDATMDVFLGDPNADESFLGRKLNASSFIDSALGSVGKDVGAGKGTLLGAGIGAAVAGVGSSMLGARFGTASRIGMLGGVLGAAYGAGTGFGRRNVAGPVSRCGDSGCFNW
jgi:hypothetical protein